MKKKMVWIGVGSNMGDRLANLRQALELLQLKGMEVVRTSSIFETAPVGFISDSNFLNGVFECRTTLTPEQTLDIISDIEQGMGRTRSLTERYISRIIDLDILIFGDSVITTKKLTIPHPRMEERRFVMEPLNELIPNELHPLKQQTIAQLYAGCSDQNRATIFHKSLLENQ